MESSTNRFFKEWAVPGPQPAFPNLLRTEDLSSFELWCHQVGFPLDQLTWDERGIPCSLFEKKLTWDAISGNYRIFQYAHGHRYSTDDVLVGWYGSTYCSRAEQVLDLGSGIGSVAAVAAWRLPGARITTIEAQRERVALALLSAYWNGNRDKSIFLGDFRVPETIRDLAGRKSLDSYGKNSFDLVLSSPPYFPEDQGIVSSEAHRAACRFEIRGGIEEYLHSGAQNLSHGGVMATVFPWKSSDQQHRFFLAAKQAQLSIVRLRPVLFKEGTLPTISLVILCKSQDLPGAFRERPWIEPPLVIRTGNGEIHPEYSAIKLAFGFPP